MVHRIGHRGSPVAARHALSVVRQFAAELERPAGVVDPGRLSTDLSGNGAGRDPADVADVVLWAAGLPDDEPDGEALNLRAWRAASGERVPRPPRTPTELLTRTV